MKNARQRPGVVCYFCNISQPPSSGRGGSHGGRGLLAHAGTL